MHAVAQRFALEQLRAPLVVGLLVAIPALFVVLAAGVLDEFSRALGGASIGDRATALGAGWAAAFLSGALGYFQVASARGADRRLALAGLGAARVAAARLLAAMALGVVVSASAYAALWLRAGVAHPAHAAAAILAFAAVYLGLGAIAGALVTDQLSGSLVVAFIFLVDAFSGPSMGNAGGLPTPTREAAELLMAAGAGENSPGDQWIGSAVTVLVAIAVAGLTFWWSARERQ